MVKILTLNTANADLDSLPPVYYLKFTREEFPEFLANPTVTLKNNGHHAKNLTVTVKDHVWDSRNKSWVTDDTDLVMANLPTASHWEWWCGYQDEMCVCERVLVP